MNLSQSIRQAVRRAPRRAAALGLTLLLAAGGIAAMTGSSGCSKKDAGDKKGGPITVSFIYVGSMRDYGYNQAHAEGAAAVKAIPGVKVVEQENVPETVEVEKAMQGVIKQDGATVVFPTSYGYLDPSVIKVAGQNTAVQFLHCGGLWKEGKTPNNIGTYFGYIDECQYISGVVAGHVSKSKKIGFIAAKPIPQVLRNINAFTLGAKSIDPAITCTVIFTGDWSYTVKEAEAANSLITQGIDVMTMHVDSPKTIIETCAKAKVFVCGYHSNGSALSSEFYLTGAEWNWAVPYVDFVNKIKEGKPIPHSMRGGLKEGFVKMSPYGPSVPEAAKKKADETKAAFLADKLVIFKGPMKDNTGKELYKDGEVHIQTDTALESMNYLVEGVIGKARRSAPYSGESAG